MLADDNASQAVHFGDDGLFAADTGATVLLEMGTLSPAHVGQLADAAGDRRIVDAPVSGSIDAAHAAELMIMVGADEATVCTRLRCHQAPNQIENLNGVLAQRGWFGRRPGWENSRVLGIGEAGARVCFPRLRSAPVETQALPRLSRRIYYASNIRNKRTEPR